MTCQVSPRSGDGALRRLEPLGVPTGALPRETNWKPPIAAAFAFVLALAGAWSSRRRPWKGGAGRKAAFALTSLPFVLAEAATGVVSLLTGLLVIPPLLGWGMAVDAGILLAGVVASSFRVHKWTPPS